jgi:hypothetical protein
MEIGKPERRIRIEPVEEPIPTPLPNPEPAVVPVEEPVPLQNGGGVKLVQTEVLRLLRSPHGKGASGQGRP